MPLFCRWAVQVLPWWHGSLVREIVVAVCCNNGAVAARVPANAWPMTPSMQPPCNLLAEPPAEIQRHLAMAKAACAALREKHHPR